MSAPFFWITSEHVIFQMFFKKFLNSSGVVHGGREMRFGRFLMKIGESRMFFLFIYDEIAFSSKKTSINIIVYESSRR